MILGGRFPLLVILVLALVVAATKGVPWILKQLRDPIPEFRVDDVRNMRYVAPYDQWPETSDEHYPATIHVHGPVESAEYASGVHPLFFERIPLKPTSVIEAKADEVVALPDGRRLSIGAILMVPSNRPAGALRDIPFDQVYYHPAGRWMTTEEAEEFRTRHGMRGSAYEWNSFNAGPAWNVEVQFETDVVLGDFVELSLRDLATGGLESRHDDLPTSQLSEDPGLISQVFPWAAIRPSPLAVHALVWQGEATTLDMPPIAPQLLTWDNDGIRLHTVVYKRDAATPEVILSGGGGLPFPGGPWGAILESLPGILPPTNTPRVGLMFGEVPQQVRSIEVRLKNGERLKPVLEYGRNTLVFNCDHDAIEAVEINIQSEIAHVVFKLPELPGFPDKNRGVTDVREMVFPPTILPANVEINDMISYALQLEYNGARGYGAKGSLVGSAGPPPNVRNLSGMTVRDVLTDIHPVS